jgi:hypothetical protein
VVVVADVMGWWMDVFVLQGEFVERLFRGEVRSCGYKKKKMVASLSSRLSFSYILIYGYK